MCNSDFWGDSVVKLGLTEPAVHHSLLAMSCFLESELDRRQHDAFAFAEYSKAIAAMRQPSSNSSSAVPLAVCALFTCIEFMLGRENAAQLHIGQGRKLLASAEASDVVKRDLVPLYTRLSLASILFEGHHASIPLGLRVHPTVPDTFASVREAQDSLFHIVDDALRLTLAAKEQRQAHGEQTAMQPFSEAQDAALDQVRRWHLAFTILTTTLTNNQHFRFTITLIQLYYHCAMIWLSTAFKRAETAYDGHIADFSAVIGLASTLVNTSHATRILHRFTFETELIAPLYWTVIKCRHPRLRRAALRLLLKDELRDRKENLWQGRELASVALRVIEIEEGAVAPSCDDWHVPLSHPPTIPLPVFGEGAEGDVVQPGDGLNGWLLRRAAKVIDGPVPPHVALSPPFGIPDTKRVSNTVVKPRHRGGLWGVMFRDTGGDEWDITKEFFDLSV